ncbi:MAG: DNA-binding protein [Nanoarchaeota archaeon]|nr:DNA-binding protein [Nanoarchaeota archaeon]
MDELEEIRKKKLMELQRQQEEQLQSNQQAQAQFEQLEVVVKQFFTKEALERYGNVKAAHPDKAVQIMVVLGQAVQQGQIKNKIDDEQLKAILKQLQTEKKDFKIKHI